MKQPSRAKRWSKKTWAVMRAHERNQKRRKEQFSAPPGYFLLRGKNADGSYTVLRMLVAPSTYTNLAGR